VSRKIANLVYGGLSKAKVLGNFVSWSEDPLTERRSSRLKGKRRGGIKIHCEKTYETGARKKESGEVEIQISSVNSKWHSLDE